MGGRAAAGESRGVCLDNRGRIFVCETFRQSRGIEDNRNHGQWLDEDLAAQTVADRLAYIRNISATRPTNTRSRTTASACSKTPTATARRTRRRSSPTASTTSSTASAPACWLAAATSTTPTFPNLWLLQDEDGDGKADVRKSLHYGYGVRVAFRGHDMHGLIMGPDGRLYFSIGDRGLNVKTQEEQAASSIPNRGAVLRCEPDGSNLEIFATGLRNPQELAFDEYGNLFTGDNNSDSGDQARWVYVVEGGDSGWRMAYQYLPRPRPVQPREDLAPAPRGAAGLHRAAGRRTSPAARRGWRTIPAPACPSTTRADFFLVDFRGGPANSGVRSFRVKPKGAGFEAESMPKKRIWSVLATDVDFGPDGAIYLSDWVNGWNGEGKGRIYVRLRPKHPRSPMVQEVKKLLAEGLAKRPPRN